jgi:DNA/RNA-binding domain of Phe-tRNA-synthetase-like protein
MVELGDPSTAPSCDVDAVATAIAVSFAPHPLLDAVAFETRFPSALAELDERARHLGALLRVDAEAPLHADDAVRAAVRDLLRHGGYKPTGRGKPASEYLLRAATEGTLASINAAVDACNAVSLHSGLPISVIDVERARAPFEVKIAPAGASYVFNASAQTIDVEGLLCLFDADGPTANAVKDAQRTKTHPQSTHTLSIIWGTRALGDRTERAFEFYRALCESVGATVTRAP